MRRRALQCAGPAAGLATLVLALALAGCSGGGASLGTLGPASLPYQPSNAIASAGYAESQLAPDRYRIEVTGYAGTPRARLEKIAATRAAEIGKDNRLRYFKIDSLAHSTRCKPRVSAHKGRGHKELQYAVLTADVSYAPTPPDPGYLESRPTFEQLRAELDQAPDPAAPADAEPFQCES